MTSLGRSKSKRPIALSLWLSANDPGYIRLLGAGRAALAALSIWLVLRTALQLLSGEGGPPIPLFGVLSGLIFLLFIIDLKPSSRKISLVLAPIPFAGAVILASLLSKNFWLNNLIMLLLFFFSYFFRRYGTRAGELALVTTVGFYIAFLLHLPRALYPLFLASVGVSLLVVYLWQFVIIPYDPARSLRRSVVAFYHNVALTVAASWQGLNSIGEATQYTIKLQRQIKQVHQNRRMIEGLFSATVSPTLWSQTRLNRLQEEMFKAERGLELLIEAAGKLSSQLDEVPDDALQILMDSLEMLEDVLWDVASGKGQAQLTEIGDKLKSQLKSSLEEKPTEEWVYSLLRIGIASQQLTQSVAGIQTIEIAWNESQIDESPKKTSSGLKSQLFNNSSKKPRFSLHPTTILGFQAVLATGLAMLAAYLLNFDHPNLVYWTAFVIIAGSTGESLRRMTMRVIGVIAGTLIGVSLAVVLPNNVSLIAVLVTLCIFMTVYSITISYIWMVFWLNIAMLLVITTLGGSALELVVLRPVSTLLGAVIAALVVVFVLPIHVQNRFMAALSEFLRVVDHYTETYVSMLVDASMTGDLRAEELVIDASFKKLEVNLPAVTYEYNPLSRAQSRLGDQATTLAVLKSYVNHLNDDVSVQPGVLAGNEYAVLIQTIQSQIHENVNALNNYLAQKQAKEVASNPIDDQFKIETAVDDILISDTVSLDAVGNRAVYHLARINDTILQVASGLRAQAASR
jgi:hypothetical protein